MSNFKVNIKHCPSCGSDEVGEARPFTNGILTSILIVFAAFPFSSKKYHCSDCGNIFKSKDIAELIRR